MNDDLIKRSDAIAEICKVRTPDIVSHQYAELFINAVCRAPSADRPSEVIYGNEHNCIMTIFGECSYAETGCGDCAVVEKVRNALFADRPKGDSVSRQYLLAEIDDLADEFSEVDENGLHSERWCGIMDAKCVIVNTPPVADRPQGEWTNAGVLTVHCSNCKSEFHELEAMNYCSNCGAQMKGADNG